MMKRNAVLLVVMLLISAVAASAQTLSKAERERLVKHLQQTEKELRAATRGLSEAQWNFKSAPDRWSVKEVAEHLTLAEDFLYSLITERVMKTPAQPEKFDAARARNNEEQVLKIIPDRTNRVQAPEPLHPTGRWPTLQEALKQFDERRKKTIQYARSEADLRVHFMDSPVLKDMDGYQWLLFVSAHTQRHIAQIKEVKADAGFPKK